MIVQDRLNGFAGAPQGDVDNYCDGKYPGQPDVAAKCKKNDWYMPPPWTDVGAIIRGIPKPGSLIVSVVHGATRPAGSGDAGGPSPDAAGVGDDGTILGIPKTILVFGGAVLAVGGALYYAKSKGKLGGYRKRRHGRRSRK